MKTSQWSVNNGSETTRTGSFDLRIKLIVRSIKKVDLLGILEAELRSLLLGQMTDAIRDAVAK